MTRRRRTPVVYLYLDWLGPRFSKRKPYMAEAFGARGDRQRIPHAPSLIFPSHAVAMSSDFASVS
jgi:hypothetical protein